MINRKFMLTDWRIAAIIADAKALDDSRSYWEITVIWTLRGIADLNSVSNCDTGKIIAL